MKFSIIVPVYNVELYIERCLQSIVNQTNKNFEVIVVNDGSTDNSQSIVEKYKSKIPNCSVYIKENGGLSDARNYAIPLAKGEYIFFLDSDDYVDVNLFEKVEQIIEKNNKPDVIRIPKRIINDEGEIIEQDKIKEFYNLTSSEAFLSIRRNKVILETACTYFYRNDFWQKNNFQFSKGKLHEDLGIIPLILLYAENVTAISCPFYNYVYRENSIMTTKNYNKDIKKAWDILSHYDFLLEKLEELKQKKNISEEAQYQYKYYITDVLFLKLRRLKKTERKQYKEEIKKRNAISNIRCDSIKSILKKLYYSILLK